jgi:threonylcarbamoyladenosine tRNA methylthiotransferase MtaB
MKTFSINTLGCKVNQYESQQIRQLLERLSLKQVFYPEKPDLAVINTCCVTHTASAKSRQYIRKAAKTAKKSTVVCGCLPALNNGELSGLDEKNVHIIRNRFNLAVTLTKIVQPDSPSWTKPPHSINTLTTTIKAKNNLKIKGEMPFLHGFDQLTSFNGHTRAFLKVQDGCDGPCSYCIIPKARPDIYSKPAEQVINEVKALVTGGHKEIVITGVCLGAYGQKTVRRKKWPKQTNDNLSKLLDKVAAIKNLARIRLSSLEPADVTEQLLDAFCRHSNIMPHLHLSLQSGSDAILKKMARQYRIDDFLRTVELIKERLDRPAITCDLIVGFPGETDSDFEKIVELANKVGFSKMHIFSFSPRKGTAAADMHPFINSKIIKERSEILRNLNDELGYKFREQFTGQHDTILTESKNGKVLGRSSRYFYVNITNNNSLTKNELVKVKLIKNLKTEMSAKMVKG